MWGMPKTENRCPNCGGKDYNPKIKEPECPACGYHPIATKQLDPISLVFCEGCGCHLSDFCTVHPSDKQKKVKL